MVDLATVLSTLWDTWLFSLPVIALTALFVAWLALARSSEPPPAGPRRIRREFSSDEVSRSFRELAAGNFYFQVAQLWAATDAVLTRQYRVTLARLPRTQRGARRHGLADLRGWRAFRREMLRLAHLSLRLLRPAGWLGEARRRRERAEFERLVADVLPKVASLEASLVPRDGARG